MKYSLLSVVVLLLFSVFYFSCEKNNDTEYFPDGTVTELFPSEEEKEVIMVSNVPELMATTRLTKDGFKVVIIKDGDYDLNEPIRITGDHVIYRSESGNRNNVVLRGRGMTGSINRIFAVTGSNFSVKNISLGEVSGNGIKLYGEKNTDSVYIQNVRFFNIKEQMVLATYNEEYSSQHADFGTIEQCTFENEHESSAKEQYGGIDINRGASWRISNCMFENINGAESSRSSGAIRFRNHSEDCIAENNIIVNCDRGILFGFNNEEHKGGIIRNNMIYVSREVGIYICNAMDVKVFNNTVFSPSDYPHAIECLDENGSVEIINNLTNKGISLPGKAISKVENNVTNAQANWFKNASRGNLHLAKNVTEVVNAAIALDDVSTDKDGDLRLMNMSDIGADER